MRSSFLGKSTYVHVFFFGKTAERSWILTSRLLPFMGIEKLSKQRTKWRRKVNSNASQILCLTPFYLQMKSRMPIDSKLTGEDKINLNTAIKQTNKLAKFSLRKRINVLKTEWWYWDDIMQATLINGISTEENDDDDDDDPPTTLTKEQENDTEEILQLLSTNSNELVIKKSLE